MANPFRAVASEVNARPSAGRRSASVFHGASTGRLYNDWRVGIFSPDYEARTEARLLRARARSLVRDNGYAAGFVDELSNNVVGPAGIRLRARVRTLTAKDLHKETNSKIEAAWLDWGFPENTSADGHDSWTDVQQLAIKTVATDGEAFFRKLKYYDNRHSFALLPIDADQVDEYYNRLPSPGTNEIRQGVEISGYGRPVAYHVWTRHPSDAGYRERIAIPADEMIHLFVRYRPNQTRGVTWFAPVLTSVRMLDGYTEAELVAARTAAAKMGFIETANPEAFPTAVDTDPDAKQRLMQADPGIIDELDPGQTFKGFDPQHPTTAYKEFTQTVLRGIGRGLNMSYITFTGDLNGTSYSSGRIGLLAERDRWRTLQTFVAVQLCRPVYLAWYPMAELAGVLTIDSRLTADKRQVQWKPRGWAWVDPLKDTQASILGIQHGLESRRQALDEEGRDLEETFQDLADEQELADEMGIDIVPAAPPVANKPMGQPSEADKEEGAQEENADGSSKALSIPTMKRLGMWRRG